MNDTMTASNRVFSNKDPVRLGVWGLGRGSHVAATATTVGFEVVAGCDNNPRFLELFRQKVPEGRHTTDAAEFLSWDFDAVLVATFCPDHAAHSIAALQAGKHVLSEVTAFHTVSEAVRLVETVERTGKVYQLAENYPFSEPNRYLAKLWRQGYFGELQYAEYSYVHDCLELAYAYIDGTPVQPGYAAHNWRSWLPWHYYNTHSLGPVMAITGARPVEVTAFAGTRRLPGYLLDAPEGLAGMAPSLIRFDHGALMRNLMGSATLDDNVQRLYGSRATAEIRREQLRLFPGGRAHNWDFSECLEVRPRRTMLDDLAARAGHGGGDFWTLYHFANEILNGVPPPIDLYRAADMTLAGIQAYRSLKCDGRPCEIPDLRQPEARDRYRDDDFAPARPDPLTLVFPATAALDRLTGFNATMIRLLRAADLWQSFAKAEAIAADLEEPEKAIALADRVLDQRCFILRAIRDARQFLEAAPADANGTRAMGEILDRLDIGFWEREDILDALLCRRETLVGYLPPWEPAPDEPLPQSPQLHMRRAGFDDLPPLRLPTGYHLRTGQGEDDALAWCRIIEEAFGDQRTGEDFHAQILQCGGYADDRLFFIEDPNGVACATAGAFGAGDEGYVHYVGVLPSHQGRKLGYLATLAALHSFRARDLKSCWLTTDDIRIPAIKTYLELGLHPMITHRSHPYRWRLLERKLAK